MERNFSVTLTYGQEDKSVFDTKRKHKEISILYEVVAFLVFFFFNKNNRM